MKLSGWGNFPVLDTTVYEPRTVEDIISHIEKGPLIARGNGRSYGDSSINTTKTLSMRHFNRILAFDLNSGELIAEAGVLLKDVIDVFLPKGWFPSVTPGTKFVTIAGMVAANVHGKNHHLHGCFGEFVNWLDIITEDGVLKRCSPTENTELFNWTVGGMGLTGVIVRVAIRLKPISSAWVKQNIEVAPNIQSAIKLFEKLSDTTYSVGWIDCLKTGKHLGRSLILSGEHAHAHELPLHLQNSPLKVKQSKNISIPFYLPSKVLNKYTVAMFNSLYFWNGKRKEKQHFTDFNSFFYPLDSVLHWNKIYGRQGFVQFQCVIPLARAEQGLHELLLAISNSKAGSFLSVLKRFGKQQSAFSFPMEGFTLSLDIPINNKTESLLRKLDQITVKNGGRFYLAKDARMSKEVFLNSEPRSEAFNAFRKRSGSVNKFMSSQSKRLGI